MAKVKKTLTDYSLTKNFSSGGGIYNSKENLVAWYQFNVDVSSSGDLPDLSGNGADLSQSTGAQTDRPAAPTSDSPVVGGRPPANFSTKSSVIGKNRALERAAEAGSRFSIVDGGSFSFWFKTADEVFSSNKVITIFEKGVGANAIEYQFQVNPDLNKFSFTVGDGQTPGTNAVRCDAGFNKFSLVKWNHVVVTYNGTPGDSQAGNSVAGTGVKIYINGKQQDLTLAGLGSHDLTRDTPGQFRIGGGGNTNLEFSLSELAHWSSVLTESEAKALYGAKTKIFPLVSGIVSNPNKTVFPQLDSRQGEYPTNARLGDHDYLGISMHPFDDSDTPFFGSGFAHGLIELVGTPQHNRTLVLTGANGHSVALECIMTTADLFADDFTSPNMLRYGRGTHPNNYVNNPVASKPIYFVGHNPPNDDVPEGGTRHPPLFNFNTDGITGNSQSERRRSLHEGFRLIDEEFGGDYQLALENNPFQRLLLANAERDRVGADGAITFQGYTPDNQIRPGRRLLNDAAMTNLQNLGYRQHEIIEPNETGEFQQQQLIFFTIKTVQAAKVIAAAINQEKKLMIKATAFRNFIKLEQMLPGQAGVTKIQAILPPIGGTQTLDNRFEGRDGISLNTFRAILPVRPTFTLDTDREVLFGANLLSGSEELSRAFAEGHQLPDIYGKGYAVESFVETSKGRKYSKEGIKPFVDGRINLDSKNFNFYRTTPKRILPGFSTSLKNKTQIVIDAQSSDKRYNVDAIFFSTGASGKVYPSIDGKQGSGMAYWNNDLKKWEMLGFNLGSKFKNNPYGLAENLNNSSSCLAFAPDPGNDFFYHNAFGVSLYDFDAPGFSEIGFFRNTRRPLTHGQPIQQFGFPLAAQYNATGSQCIKMSDYINKPFLVEKIQVEMSGSFGLTGLGIDYSEGVPDGENLGNTIGSKTWGKRGRIQKQFFLLNQSTNGDDPHLHPEYMDIPLELVGDRATDLGTAGKHRLRPRVHGYRELIGFAKIDFTPRQHPLLTTYRNRFSDAMQSLLARATSNTMITPEDMRFFEDDIFNDNRDHVVLVSSESFGDAEYSTVKTRYSGRFTFDFYPSVSHKNSFSNFLPQGNQYPSKPGGGALFEKDLKIIVGNEHGTADLNGTLSSRQLATSLFAERPRLHTVETGTSLAESFSQPRTTTDIARKQSPYLLRPTDRLILGWQNHPFAPVYNTVASASANVTYSDTNSVGKPTEFTLGERCVDFIKGVKITLFGSMVENQEEYHPPMNQQLTSRTVHESIGSDPVCDQFETAVGRLDAKGTSDQVMSEDPMVVLGFDENQNPVYTTSERGVLGYRAHDRPRGEGSMISRRYFSTSFESAVRFADSTTPMPHDILSTYYPGDLTLIADVNITPSITLTNLGIDPRRTLPVFGIGAMNAYREFLDASESNSITGVSRDLLAGAKWGNVLAGKRPMGDGRGEALGNKNEILKSDTSVGFSPSPPPTVTTPRQKFVGNFGVSTFVRAGSDPYRTRGGETLKINQLIVDFNTTTTTPNFRLFTTRDHFEGTKSTIKANAPFLDKAADQSHVGTRKNKKAKDLQNQFWFGVSAGLDKSRHNGLPVKPIGDKYFTTAVRGFKYGLMSSPPLSPKINFRRDSFGQYRDMLEFALDGAMVYDRQADPFVDRNDKTPDPSFLALSPAVTIKFISRAGISNVHPMTTNCQNLSHHFTSSVPFIDGQLTERFGVLPDHEDVITITEHLDIILDEQ